MIESQGGPNLVLRNVGKHSREAIVQHLKRINRNKTAKPMRMGERSSPLLMYGPVVSLSIWRNRGRKSLTSKVDGFSV